MVSATAKCSSGCDGGIRSNASGCAKYCKGQATMFTIYFGVCYCCKKAALNGTCDIKYSSNFALYRFKLNLAATSTLSREVEPTTRTVTTTISSTEGMLH